MGGVHTIQRQWREPDAGFPALLWTLYGTEPCGYSLELQPPATYGRLV